MFDIDSSGHSPRIEKVPTRQGKPVKSNGAQRSGWGISALYLYLFTVQIKPSRPNLSHSAIEGQFCQFSVKFLASPPLLAGPKIFFHQSLNPLSAVLNGNVSYNSSECIYVHENVFNI